MRGDVPTDLPLEVVARKTGDVTVLCLAGQINEMGADVLSAELDRVLEEGDCRLIFDLSDVNFLSSTGLGQVMRAYRAVKGHGFVRIAGPQPLVADLFKLTKLDKLLVIYPTVQEALAQPQ